VSVYSHSRISSFENCPLQYRYRYIDQIRCGVESVEAFVGKLVHEVLESLYADLPRARVAGAAEYVGRFEALWMERLTPSVRVVRSGMTLADYRALGARCIESFHRRHHPFEGGEVLGRELEVEFSLDTEGRYQMRGFIDRVDRVAPGILEIHDYKTGVLPRAGALRNDRQLTLYEIAVRERFEGVKEVRQVWHYLAHDREFDQTRTADDLRRTRVAAIRAIQRIEDTVDFPPRASALCSWCEYQGICPEWTQKMPAAGANVTPPPEGLPLPVPIPTPAFEARSGQYLLFGAPGR